MIWSELKSKSKQHFYAIYLDRNFPKPLRAFLRRGSALFLLVSFSLSLGSMPFYFSKADGFVFLFLFIFLALAYLEAFYRSMRGQEGDYALSNILLRTDELDATAALFKTLVGEETLLKAGLQPIAIEEFLMSERNKALASSLFLPEGNIGLGEYVGALYGSDSYLRDFLSERSLGREDLVRSAQSVSEEVKMKTIKQSWLKMALLSASAESR